MLRRSVRLRSRGEQKELLEACGGTHHETAVAMKDYDVPRAVVVWDCPVQPPLEDKFSLWAPGFGIPPTGEDSGPPSVQAPVSECLASLGVKAKSIKKPRSPKPTRLRIKSDLSPNPGSVSVRP